MNTEPMLYEQPIQRLPGCGRDAEANRARYFWQSRMTTTGQRAEPLQLADLDALARAVRR